MDWSTTLLTHVYVPIAMSWPHEETQNSLSWQPLHGVALPWVFSIHRLQPPRPADGTWHQQALCVLLLCHPFRITQASEVLQVSWVLFWRKHHLNSTRLSFLSKSVQLFWGFSPWAPVMLSAQKQGDFVWLMWRSLTKRAIYQKSCPGNKFEPRTPGGSSVQ